MFPKKNTYVYIHFLLQQRQINLIALSADFEHSVLYRVLQASSLLIFVSQHGWEERILNGYLIIAFRTEDLPLTLGSIVPQALQYTHTYTFQTNTDNIVWTFYICCYCCSNFFFLVLSSVSSVARSGKRNKFPLVSVRYYYYFELQKPIPVNQTLYWNLPFANNVLSMKKWYKCRLLI